MFQAPTKLFWFETKNRECFRKIVRNTMIQYDFYTVQNILVTLTNPLCPQMKLLLFAITMYYLTGGNNLMPCAVQSCRFYC